MKSGADDAGPFDAACRGYNVGDEDKYEALEEEYSEEEDDSDEEYASIQRPAFVVEGEPNFESGPPEDGLEYLRRVRYRSYILSLSLLSLIEGTRVPEVKAILLN